MRESDGQAHPKAVARAKRGAIRLWSGLVIAAAGLIAVFLLHEVYLGFFVALIGSGIVPFDKAMALLPFGKK